MELVSRTRACWRTRARGIDERQRERGQEGASGEASTWRRVSSESARAARWYQSCVETVCANVGFGGATDVVAVCARRAVRKRRRVEVRWRGSRTRGPERHSRSLRLGQLEGSRESGYMAYRSTPSACPSTSCCGQLGQSRRRGRDQARGASCPPTRPAPASRSLSLTGFFLKKRQLAAGPAR